MAAKRFVVTTTQDQFVMVLVKGPEKYFFTYDAANRIEVMRQAGRFAANPDLSLTWYDAAVITQAVRSQK